MFTSTVISKCSSLCLCHHEPYRLADHISANIKKKQCKTTTTITRHSQGTQELVVDVQRDASSSRIVRAFAGLRPRRQGLVSHLAQAGATPCIEPRAE